MGEETFFINKISNFFEKNFISEEHRGFNLEIHYGRDSNIETIINSSKSFPMMSDKKLIIVVCDNGGHMVINRLQLAKGGKEYICNLRAARAKNLQFVYFE